MRVGKIVECEAHPNSDKLYIEKIDVGEGSLRKIGSGLQKHISLDDMLSDLVIVAANLKERKLADIMSQGMVLCASSAEKDKIELLRPPAGSKVGERVQLEGNPCNGKPVS